MRKRTTSLKLVHVKPACENCSVRRLCLPTSLDGVELSRMDGLVRRCKPIAKGGFLYRTGDDFTSLYAIQSGVLKTYGLTADGKEQVTGFHLVGELVGLDAIYTSVHPCNAVALEQTEVCRLPYGNLEALVQKTPALQKAFSRIMSRELMRDGHMLMLLGGATAEQRLARFLANLHTRMRERGGSPDEILLVMTRQDIGNYLGLAVETVSRHLTLLQERGVITIENRRIKLRAPDVLMQGVS